MYHSTRHLLWSNFYEIEIFNLHQKILPIKAHALGMFPKFQFFIYTGKKYEVWHVTYYFLFQGDIVKCAGVCLTLDWIKMCIKKKMLVRTDPYIVGDDDEWPVVVWTTCNMSVKFHSISISMSLFWWFCTEITLGKISVSF